MNPFTNLRIISSYPIFLIVYITFLSFKHMQGVCMSLLIRFILLGKVKKRPMQKNDTARSHFQWHRPFFIILFRGFFWNHEGL